MLFGTSNIFYSPYESNQVVLVVNVASKCGFTKQYAGLEELYQKYKDRGFTIIGCPCNQFAGQGKTNMKNACERIKEAMHTDLTPLLYLTEPGTEEEIVSFCKLTYDVSFPITAKV